jgi:hypothetical protein
MSDFQREERYVVFKLRDLVETEKDAVLRLANGINAQSIECVVVESDWPNYEHTWQTIERVSDGSYSDPYAEIEQLRAKAAYARFQGMLNEDDPAKRAVSVPDAYALVPVAPTQRMLAQGEDGIESRCVIETWDKMLRAAPTKADDSLRDFIISEAERAGDERNVYQMLEDANARNRELYNALALILSHLPEPECSVWRDVQSRARSALAEAYAEGMSDEW